MARTKAEIRAFLDAQVGSIPQHPAPYTDLSGQCVTGVKVLMDFLGVPNPYQARGNAKDVDDTLLRQGIAREGKGWLTIVVNRQMGNIGGVVYGHIWIDLQNEANYESNGARALRFTKNTRPISQGQQFVNLDNYVKGEDMAEKINKDTSRIIRHGILGRNGLKGRAYGLDGSDQPDGAEPWVGGELTNQFIQDVFGSPEGRQWRDSQDSNSVIGINKQLERLPAAETEALTARTQVGELTKVIEIKDGEIKRVTDENTKLKAQLGDPDLTIKQAIRVLVQTIKDALSGK